MFVNGWPILWPAFFQHEFDHINGRVYLDRVKDTRTLMTRILNTPAKSRMPKSKFGFADSLAVLRIRDFRFFLLSRFFATLASQMQVLIVSWQIYQMTKDPLALGLIGLIEASVFILFSFRAGHFSDQREKRIIILYAQGLLMACGLALIAVTHSGAHVWAIYSIVAITGDLPAVFFGRLHSLIRS